MNRSSLRSVILAVLLVMIPGCGGGGLNCPFDPPSCCYNVLFGCGPFDLPFGCSCSSYGLARLGDGAALKAPVSAAVSGAKNVWGGDLTRVQSTCAALPKKLQGTLTVQRNDSRITITVPGYGKLRGRRRGGRYLAAGSYAPFTPSCKGRANVAVVPRGARSSDVSASVTYGCGGPTLCSGRYSGTISRR